MIGNDGYHYINNEVFYTMKLPGKTIDYLDNGAIKTNDYIINIANSNYDTSLYHNGKSLEDEKMLLKSTYQKEIDYFDESFGLESDFSEEFFTNEEGKLFYLTNYEIPKSKVNTEEDYLVKLYILYFVANEKIASISFPLFVSENEEEKLSYIYSITASVDIFPSTISLNFLKRRISHTSDEPISINYEGANFKFVVPDYLNVIESTKKTEWYASFPDVNNIKNAIVLNITKKEKFKTFKAFNDEVMPREKIGEKNNNQTLLIKEKLSNTGQLNGESYRVQYMLDNLNIYHSKKVTFQTKNYFGLIVFTATNETYADNINRFDSFLEGFDIEN